MRKIKKCCKRYKSLLLFCGFVVLFILDVTHYINGIKNDFSRDRVERRLFVLCPMISIYYTYLIWKYLKTKKNDENDDNGKD